jgi:hypothetical protein
LPTLCFERAREAARRGAHDLRFDAARKSCARTIRYHD